MGRPASRQHSLQQVTGKPIGRQRAFRSVEIASRVRVVADKSTPLNYVLVPPQKFALLL